MKPATLLLLSLGVLPAAGMAENAQQPYAGHQDRQISSLSEDDIAQLEHGSGWSLALPAELNGYPGPRHILELHEELELTAEQNATIIAIFENMKAEAIMAGRAFIEAERRLDALFREKRATPETLATAVANASRARAELRLVHLSQHLKTVDVLTPAQTKRYNHLRGYGSDDPCGHVPEGHDAEMWRRHNHCDG
jgi:Spy/CpxP family protein refolding chaperone